MPDETARGSSWRYVSSWLVLLIGCALSVAAWRYVSATVDGEAQAQFERRADESKRIVEQHLRVHAEVLRGLQGLFMHMTERTIMRDEFRRYVASLDLSQRHPGIQALSLVRYVRGGERVAFESQVRADRSVDPGGYPRFAIRPAGERPDYFVPEFIEPFAESRQAFGLDMGAESNRRAALEQARDSGTVAASASIRLFMDPDKPNGFLLAAPVYRTAARLDTLAERRAAFVGCVVAIFRMDEMMRGLFGQRLLDELDIELFDVDAARGDAAFSERSLLFDSAAQAQGHVVPPHATDVSARFRKVDTLNVSGRNWSLVATALPAFKGSRAEGYLPPLVLLGGLAMSLLLAGLTRSLVASGLRAERTATRIAHDLLAVEQRYSELIGSLNDVLWTLSLPDYRVAFVSASIETMTGHPPARYLEDAAFWPTVFHPDDLDTVMQALAQVADAGMDLECRFLRADGAVRWVHLRARLAVGGDGTPRIDGIASDITPRKQAEEALRDSESKFRSILESAADGILIIDERGGHPEHQPARRDPVRLRARRVARKAGRNVDSAAFSRATRRHAPNFLHRYRAARDRTGRARATQGRLRVHGRGDLEHGAHQ